MAEGKRPETTYAWWVLSLLFGAALLNYMDRTVLAVVMPQVRRDLSLSNAQYGFAVNSFLLLYMVTYPVGGFAADRLGVRRMFVFNVLTWSVAGMLQALSRGFVSLCAFRGLLGLAEGPFPATAMRGLADWFPSATRAKPISVLFCGISLGSMVAPPLVASITLLYGWRAAFLFTGALGLLLVPPWLLLQRRIALVFGSRDPVPARLIDAAKLGDTKDDPSVREVVRRPKYLFVLAARSLTDATWFFFLFWMAGYFQESRGFDLARVGRLLWIPFLSADVGALAGSWISSAMIRRGLGVDRSRKSVMTVSALLVLSIIGAAYATSSLVSLGLLSVALLGLQSWASNLHTVITEISPVPARRHSVRLHGRCGDAPERHLAAAHRARCRHCRLRTRIRRCRTGHGAGPGTPPGGGQDRANSPRIKRIQGRLRPAWAPWTFCLDKSQTPYYQ